MGVAEMLLEFKKKTNGGAFINISRADVAFQLKQRLDDPTKIDQAGSSLCGPAAVMFSVARRKPELYAQYVIDLYEKGQAQFGTLNVAPSEACKNYKPVRIEDVDWIALASLRDSDNKILDYSSVETEAGGITMPATVASWFRHAGYSQIYQSTQWFGALYKTDDHIMRAGTARRHGRDVCLFVNYNIALAGKETDMSVNPNHWIVLTRPIQLDAKNRTISIEVYTWGGVRTIPFAQMANGAGNLDELLKNYYGYVAAC